MTTGPVARSETEAFNDYSGALQRVPACFVNGVGFRRGPTIDPVVGGRLLTHGGLPFRLNDRHGTAVVAIALRLHYRAVRMAPQAWAIETVNYIYEAHSVTKPPHLIASYHWHPHVQGIAFAHCHAQAALPTITGLHLPTLFITLREFFKWLMRDFGVAPLATTTATDQVLTDADSVLRASLSWAAPHP